MSNSNIPNDLNSRCEIDTNEIDFQLVYFCFLSLSKFAVELMKTVTCMELENASTFSFGFSRAHTAPDTRTRSHTDETRR